MFKERVPLWPRMSYWSWEELGLLLVEKHFSSIFAVRSQLIMIMHTETVLNQQS